MCSTRLSTPVVRYMRRHPSWMEAPNSCRLEFRQYMQGKAYGYNETVQAWHFFYAGYKAGVWHVPANAEA
jgi:hypothetical protein